MTPTFWTDERVAILKSRRAADWPARAIATLLGCTRNAVLGKAYRLDLPPAFHRGGRPVTTGAGIMKRARALARGDSLPRQGKRRRRLIDLPHVKDEPPSRNVAFVDLKAGECRWIGDDGCCGHATMRLAARTGSIASPYCGFHSARAYRAPRQRQRPPLAGPRESFAYALASEASGRRESFI